MSIVRGISTGFPPDRLSRVQIRTVRWKMIEPQTVPIAPSERSQSLRAMIPGIVKDQEDLLEGLKKEFQECLERLGIERIGLLENEIGLFLYGDRTVELALPFAWMTIDRGSLSTTGPALPCRPFLLEIGLVLEEDDAPSALAFFWIRRWIFFSHRSCAAWSARASLSRELHAEPQLVGQFPDVTRVVSDVPSFHDVVAYHRARPDVALVSSRLRSAFNKQSSHAEINDLYNRSKTCLNIHHSQSMGATNPRTFKILGSGNFLLTDRILPEKYDIQRDRHYAYYRNSEELLENLTNYLEDEETRMKISRLGYESVRRNHTFDSRVQEIIKDFYR